MTNDLVYQRHVDFYRDVFGKHIRQNRSVFGLDMLHLGQPAGDFSDAPSNDLTIQRVLCRVRMHADFGSGRFGAWTEMGSFLMAPPRSQTSIVIDDYNHHDSLSINWDRLLEADSQGLLPRDGDFGSIHSSLRIDPEMYRLFEQLWGADPASTQLEQDILIAALIERLGAWSNERSSRKVKERERLSPTALRRTIALLEDSEANDLSLAELASVAGLSSHHFCRAFRATTGLPPHRYRIANRMIRARSLLIDRRQAIGEVAAAVGYLDAAYFSRLFRRETGFSPRQWQLEWQ